MTRRKPTRPIEAEHAVSNTLSAPNLSPSNNASNANPNDSQLTFDKTGQIASPGAKPKVTATLWEEEQAVCFRVEVNGVCVGRREDNHMFNGTTLLEVAGMTHEDRDTILRAEKNRHMAKVGPEHLKGVWIPYDRALEFANQNGITEDLYPLFVHDIGRLLYGSGH